QASPTSDPGFITKTTPYGAPNPVNPIALAIVGGATFVSRGFSGDVPHLASLIKQGVSHRGFALIDVLQPCVTFNHVNTFSWYRERIYKLEEQNYDPTDKVAAMAKAQEWGTRIPIGVIYRGEAPVFEERLPALKKGPPVRQKVEPDRQELEKLLDEFR
ncbi:MAG: 2-oxoacid ferredoxin oxidoreductase, partial [Chloroflexi bacterium]|nr:2-oxoacid ferredoxin oxidoreductase [Chloroflexota bacterium]